MSDFMDNCPVKPPKLLKAKSTVVRCGSCHAWAYRYPAFMGDDSYFECEKCGNTSVIETDGRDYGQKSREWDQIVGQFNQLYTDIHQSDWDTVVTDPPMKDLDWGAIEAWYRSMNIYRVFIQLPAVEVVQSDDGAFHITVNPD